MWPEREIHHSSPDSSEVKKEWRCISTFYMLLRGVQGNLYTSLTVKYKWDWF
jgi:hypothetical protein